MVRLMGITELEDVMKLWEENLINILGNEKKEEIDAYKEAAEEMMAHANVYVHLDDEKITGFISIVGGYYVSNIVFNDYSHMPKVLDYVKKRYDELQVDVFAKSKANEILVENGFTFLGTASHDVLSYEEKEYEWLK